MARTGFCCPVPKMVKYFGLFLVVLGLPVFLGMNSAVVSSVFTVAICFWGVSVLVKWLYGILVGGDSPTPTLGDDDAELLNELRQLRQRRKGASEPPPSLRGDKEYF